MVTLIPEPMYVMAGRKLFTKTEYEAFRTESGTTQLPNCEEAKKNTLSYPIIKAHNHGDDENFKLKFDSLTSHDMTNVNIIQTARACGLEKFPLPVVLTNCQNTLCQVGGTINRDDHNFALTAAQKYGGINVPINIAVIHTYMREMMAGCGKMIMGADSHTRYGALGTMAIGEGGGELVKQMMSQTYDMAKPEVVGIYLSGKPNPGIGPHDVALAIIGATYTNNFVKNTIMEFIGDGIEHLSMDFRNGIDVMTTETACWSSIWETDKKVQEYLAIHGRLHDYRELRTGEVCYYDRMVYVDLSKIKSMIAMPFHPSNTYTIEELLRNAQDILHKVELDAIDLTGNKQLRLNLHEKYKDGYIYVDQGIIGGCSGGTFENISAAADILQGADIGNNLFNMTVYPDSQPTNLELMKHGVIPMLLESGVICREAICGPCTGVGEVPGDGEFSIRHNTRNFIYREGARPSDGQHAWVALMDARSIAATAANAGRLTSAEDMNVNYSSHQYFFYADIYKKKVYDGTGRADDKVNLLEGPNIKPWPDIPPLPKHLLVKVCSYIMDPVTTTDELIPTGDTSSYRSNPIKMSEFTLYRRDPKYVPTARTIVELEARRSKGENIWEENELKRVTDIIRKLPIEELDFKDIGIGSSIYAKKPGDGSAREQAASCQRVLGGAVNLVDEYATRRYRSNLINWGIVPFETKEQGAFTNGDYILFPNIKKFIEGDEKNMVGYVLKDSGIPITVTVNELNKNEREIISAGCMINFTKLNS